MDNLFIIYETYTNGYKTDISDIISLLAIFCGILVIISKNPIVSVHVPFWVFVAPISLMALGLSFIGMVNGVSFFGYKTDILDDDVLLVILRSIVVICLLLTPVIFLYCKYTLKFNINYTELKNLKFPLKLYKRYTELKKNLKFPRLALIKLGYYYANKIDNSYYASLNMKIIKKHLDIKITTGDIKKDLYKTSPFGPIYYYRIIRGFMNRSILISLIKNLSWTSWLLIFLHRSKNLTIDLATYSVDIWSMGLSALSLIEFFGMLGLIFRLFELVLKWWTIRDRHASIFNVETNLLPKLSESQKFYFRLGVAIYNVSSRLRIIGQVIFTYLILCNLDIISPYIKVDQIFDFISYILDYILKLCGFVRNVWAAKVIFFAVLAAGLALGCRTYFGQQ